MLPASLPNLSALEAPAPVPAPAEAPAGNATQPAAAEAVAAKQPAVVGHAPAATAAKPAATTAAAAATHTAAASGAAVQKPKPAAFGTAAGGAAAERMVEAAAVQPASAKPVGAMAAKPVVAAQPAAAKPTRVPTPKPAAKPVVPAKAVPTQQPVVAQQPPVIVPQGPPRMLISQGPDYALALPNPAVPQRAGVPASVIFPGAVTAGARTTLGPFRMQALPPYPLQANRAVGYADLVPVVQFSNNHYYLHQVGMGGWTGRLDGGVRSLGFAYQHCCCCCCWRLCTGFAIHRCSSHAKPAACASLHVGSWAAALPLLGDRAAATAHAEARSPTHTLPIPILAPFYPLRSRPTPVPWCS